MDLRKRIEGHVRATPSLRIQDIYNSCENILTVNNPEAAAYFQKARQKIEVQEQLNGEIAFKNFFDRMYYVAALYEEMFLLAIAEAYGTNEFVEVAQTIINIYDKKVLHL